MSCISSAHPRTVRESTSLGDLCYIYMSIKPTRGLCTLRWILPSRALGIVDSTEILAAQTWCRSKEGGTPGTYVLGSVSIVADTRTQCRPRPLVLLSGTHKKGGVVGGMRSEDPCHLQALYCGAFLRTLQAWCVDMAHCLEPNGVVDANLGCSPQSHQKWCSST
jgi:hypothetical protein